jgi:hypothetical protein
VGALERIFFAPTLKIVLQHIRERSGHIAPPKIGGTILKIRLGIQWNGGEKWGTISY